MLNSSLLKVNRFLRISSSRAWMYRTEESHIDVLVWEIIPPCVSCAGWWWLGNNSKLWTSCWQVATWWQSAYFCRISCCAVESFFRETSGLDLQLLNFLPLRITLSICTQLSLWEKKLTPLADPETFLNPFTVRARLHSVIQMYTRQLICTSLNVTKKGTILSCISLQCLRSQTNHRPISIF